MVSIALIANGDPLVGGGHISRCLTLGRVLKEKGAAVTCIVKPDAEDLINGFQVQDMDVVYCSFIQTELNKVLADVDIVGLDYYDWAASIERVIGPPGRKLFVIDDLANRQHDCDLLLDQNFGRSPYDYENLVPDKTELLIGSDYALIRPEFQQFRDASISRRSTNAPAASILVSLGMTDVGGVTLDAVSAIRDAGIDCRLDVVLPRKAPSLEGLQAMAHADNLLNLHIEPSNMAELMLNADVGLGAVGSTTWERFCMGLPTVGLALAKNQQEAARRLHAAGLMQSFPNTSNGRIDAMNALKSLMIDPALLRSQSHLVSTRVDGLGAGRVADAILRLCA